MYFFDERCGKDMSLETVLGMLNWLEEAECLINLARTFSTSVAPLKDLFDSLLKESEMYLKKADKISEEGS
jgi:hypothetical protein